MKRYWVGVGLGLVLSLGAAGCHKTPASTTSDATDQNGADPAGANMAPVGGSSAQPAQVLGQRAQNESRQQGEDYTQQQAAPIERRAPDSGDQSAPQNYPDNGGGMTDAQAEAVYNSDLTDDQASDPPPPLPEYDQPPAPDPDYLWTPGYWAWGPGGYYWVPGVWAAAPYVGALWTPGYWGFVGGFYRFHHGFWGLHIGFYGGVDYGYGYVGHGYYGGYWNHDHFFYNTAVNRVNVNVIRNVYVHNVVIDNVVVNNRIVNRVSYNGGRGGVAARPLPAEVAVLHENRIPPMAAQVQVQREASQNKAQFYSENKGRPAVTVAARPVVADKTLPAPLPRTTAPALQQGFRGGDARPAQTQTPQQAERPQPQVRNAPEAARPVQEAHPVQPQQARPVQPQPEARPVQPQSQSQSHPVQPQPQSRPAQPQPQARPAPEARPAPQQTTQPKAEERHAPAQAPHPQPEARPAPQPHPAPAAPKSEPPHEEEKPRSR